MNVPSLGDIDMLRPLHKDSDDLCVLMDVDKMSAIIAYLQRSGWNDENMQKLKKRAVIRPGVWERTIKEES